METPISTKQFYLDRLVAVHAFSVESTHLTRSEVLRTVKSHLRVMLSFNSTLFTTLSVVSGGRTLVTNNFDEMDSRIINMVIGNKPIPVVVSECMSIITDLMETADRVSVEIDRIKERGNTLH